MNSIDDRVEHGVGPSVEAEHAIAPTISACPLCDAEHGATLFHLKHYNIVRCSQCGFDFNAHFAGGGDTGDTFDEAYFLEVHGAAFRDYQKDFRRDPSLQLFLRGLDKIESYISPGRVLDVGPGLGTFLCVAREKGWLPQGVDVSHFATRHIKEVHGIDVFEGSLHEMPDSPGNFDVITFWDSIEHVARPRQDLEHALRLLRPGGILLLTTDIYDCLVANIAAAAYRASFGKVQYPVERVYIDRNLAYFTQNTLRRLVREVGFHELYLAKMEYPIEKISLGPVERVALRLIYAVSALTHRQAQVTLVATKI